MCVWPNGRDATALQAVVNASDLKVVKAGNALCKYADDTYIIIPSSNVDTRIEELDNVERWAKVNNLTLNRAKCRVGHSRRQEKASAGVAVPTTRCHKSPSAEGPWCNY